MPPVSKFAKSVISACISASTLQPAVAANIQVDTSADDTVDVMGCSLREAVASMQNQQLQPGCSNSGDNFGNSDTIELTVQDVNLANSNISVSNANFTLLGNGAYISANGRRAFNISDSTINIDSLTIQGATVGADGGALRVTNSTLSLSNSKLYGNRANRGGAIYIADSHLTLSNCEIYGNSAVRGGGGIRANRVVGRVDSTVIANNSAYYDAGLQLRDGSVAVSNSSVHNNSGDYGVGGIAISASAVVTVSNSTVSSNSSVSSVGGIRIAGSQVTLENATVFDNVSNATGEVANLEIIQYNSLSVVNSNVSIKNSIIGGSGGADCTIQSGSTITSDKASIIQAGDCGTQARAIDPKLLALADNGGKGQTHLPDTDSPALNTGNLEVCDSRDQRGFRRESGGFFSPVVTEDGKIAVIDLSGKCDVGAVEVP